MAAKRSLYTQPRFALELIYCVGVILPLLSNFAEDTIHLFPTVLLKCVCVLPGKALTSS